MSQEQEVKARLSQTTNFDTNQVQYVIETGEGGAGPGENSAFLQVRCPKIGLHVLFAPNSVLPNLFRVYGGVFEFRFFITAYPRKSAYLFNGIYVRVYTGR